MLRLFSRQKRKREDSSTDSEDDAPKKKITAIPKSFAIRKKKEPEGLFVLDTAPRIDEEEIFISGGEEEKQATTTPAVDKELQKLLSKAKCGPAHEKNLGLNETLGKRALKRQRKAEKEKTAGKDWFNLPATELTEERRQDLELIQMRAAIDPTRHYRRNDRTALPKYFQIGHIVDTPEDYYSGRLTNKQRHKTITDELLNDFEFIDRTKAKYKTLRAAAIKTKRGAFQRGGGPSKRKKERKEKSGKGKKKHE